MEAHMAEILLVDDVAPNHRLFAMLLRGQTHTVTVAEKVEEAIAEFHIGLPHKFELVLTGWMNGLGAELVQHIRNVSHHTVPIMIASSNIGQVVRVMEEDPDLYKGIRLFPRASFTLAGLPQALFAAVTELTSRQPGGGPRLPGNRHSGPHSAPMM
jgi:CheY-like chemotaxis protein